MKKYFLYIVICLLAGFSSCIEEPDGYSNSNEGNFEALWHIMDTRYCFFEYKDIDWNAIHNEYKSKLNLVYDKYDLFDLMTDMIDNLEDGHVNLYSNFDVSSNYKIFEDSVENFNSKVILSSNYLGNNYRKVNGLRYTKIKNGKIGYVYYGSFENTFSDQNIKNIFDSFADCDGLIIDVRNNGGGSLGNSERLASYFFNKSMVTGYIRHKTGNGHSDFSKPTEIKTPAHASVFWTKPVAILINRNAYSATNDFVNRMQLVSNAFSVGSWTGGGGGMPMSSELPNGWMIRFSACPMYDSDMNQTEFGIAPDYYVTMKESDVASNIDTVIEEAASIIEALTF